MFKHPGWASVFSFFGTVELAAKGQKLKGSVRDWAVWSQRRKNFPAEEPCDAEDLKDEEFRRNASLNFVKMRDKHYILD